MMDESLIASRRGPGERIKAARIKAGRDLEWVAAQLRLRKSVVEALEANDYENLPPPVFVQGYLRSFADIVGLPPQEIVQSYHDAVAEKKAEAPPLSPNRILEKKKAEPVAASPRPEKGTPATTAKPVTPPVADAKPKRPAEQPVSKPGADSNRSRPQKSATSSPAKSADSESLKALRKEPRFKPKPLSMPAVKLLPKQVMMKWAIRLALLLLAILVLNWALGKMSNIRVRSPEAVWHNLQQKWSGLFGDESAGKIPERVSAIQPEQPAGLQPLPVQPLSGDTVLLQPPALTDSLFDPDPNVGDMGAAAEAKAGKIPKEIDLELLGNCWVEVEDSTGEYRLVGELKKGERHRLKGSPPYRVLFGRSKMVRLTVDGEPYDFSQLQQGSVARFSLDP